MNIAQYHRKNALLIQHIEYQIHSIRGSFDSVSVEVALHFFHCVSLWNAVALVSSCVQSQCLSQPKPPLNKTRTPAKKEILFPNTPVGLYKKNKDGEKLNIFIILNSVEVSLFSCLRMGQNRNEIAI